MTESVQGRILVVDDERPIREMLARRYAFRGWEVFDAADGAAALAILEAEPIDVLLTDIVMPGMGGIELMREIRDNHPEVGFAAMTGYVELAKLLQAMRLGAEDCFYKPFQNLAEIDAVVDSIAARRRNWERKLAQLRNLAEES